MDAVRTVDQRVLYLCPKCRCLIGNVSGAAVNTFDCRSVTPTYMTAAEFAASLGRERIRIHLGDPL